MIKDFNEREIARTSVGRNLVVEAGAGTGKTTLLIDRICFLVLTQNIPLDSMAVLTFTEKASAEIKNRLMFKISKVIAELNNAATEDETTLLVLKYASAREVLPRAQAAYNALDKSLVCTIHSFCSYILKKFPVEAGVSPALQIDTGQRTEELFKRAWHKWLNRELGLEAKNAALWQAVLKELTLDDVYALAFNLSSSKLAAYNPLKDKEILAEACLANARTAEELAKMFLNGKKPRAIERALTAGAQTLRAAARCLLKADFKCDKQPEEIIKTDAMPAAGGWDRDTFNTARHIINFASYMRPEKQNLLLELFTLLIPFAQNFRAMLDLHGLISFDDLLIKTRGLLKTNPAVRTQLKNEFKAIFIDEFQDTDPVQGELLLYLAEVAGENANTWQNVHLEAGKLFVVGDPKQSIYRFRGADISAYQTFTDHILKQGGVQCFLQTNFRSTKKIISLVNHLTAAVMKEQRGFQSAYKPIYEAKMREEEKHVEFNFIVPEEDQKPSARALRQNQAELAAKWIAASGRNPGDIAILMRVSTDFNIYADALKRHGIKYNMERSDDFYSAQEINDIINLLRAIDNPEDKIALTGVLRSPLFAFTDEEILSFELNYFTKAQNERLNNCYKTLAKFNNLSGRIPLNALLDTIFKETFFTESCSLAYDGENTAANINTFINIMSERTAADALSLRQFLTSFEESKEHGPRELNNALDAVNIMTIHASKGLEFPVVIMPDLSRSNSSAGKKTDYHYSWQYDMHGLKAGALADPNFAFLEVHSAQHSRAEEARMFYVALTRAREELVLISDLQTNKESVNNYLAAGGFMEDGAPAAPPVQAQNVKLNLHKYKEPQTFIFKFKPAASAAKTKLKNPAAWAEAEAARAANYARTKEEKYFISPSSLAKHEGAQQASALEVGTLVHEALENMDFAAPKIETDNEEVREILTKATVLNELKNYKILAREMPFTFKEENGVLNGVIDLVCEKNEDIYIFDFKTDKTRSAQKYAPQLAAYARAIQNFFPGRTVKCGIIFLRDGGEICLIN